MYSYMADVTMEDEGGQGRFEAYHLMSVNGESQQGEDTGISCQVGVEAYHPMCVSIVKVSMMKTLVPTVRYIHC